MKNEVIFYKLDEKDGWRFGGFQDLGPFDFANFRLENPNGDLLMVDLDRVGRNLSLGEKVVMTTVPLDDGRVVNVFPSDGGIQVYDAPHVRGYQLKLPLVEKVAQESFLRKNQKNQDWSTIAANMIG